MPNGFPGAPRTLKGALVAANATGPQAGVIIFQYNPDQMTRTLQPQMAGGESAGRGEVLRLKGAPIETIKVDVEIDATDQLEAADKNALTTGIYPQLSALETLVYPQSSIVIANTIMLAAGTIEIIPVEAPMTLFVYGPKRVLPVRISDFSITEEAHDTSLNPIRAKVSLGLRVLSYNDFPPLHPGYALFLAHQISKEVLAAGGRTADLSAVTGGNFSLGV
jgi:hypothetical protein